MDAPFIEKVSQCANDATAQDRTMPRPSVSTMAVADRLTLAIFPPKRTLCIVYDIHRGRRVSYSGAVNREGVVGLTRDNRRPTRALIAHCWQLLDPKVCLGQDGGPGQSDMGGFAVAKSIG
jgi:hypothetical protein